MSKLSLNTTFAVEVADRAIKSAAQGFVAYAGGIPLNAWAFSWIEAVGMTLGMAALSVATSMSTGSLFKRGATTLPPPRPRA